MRDNIGVEILPDAGDGSPRQVVINDHRAGRAWSGEGKTTSEAATEAVRRLLGDRRAREYME